MNFKTTGLLLALLIIVVALVWLIAPKGEQLADDQTTVTETPQSTDEYVFDPRPDADKLVRVAVEREGKPPLVFERIEGDRTTPSADQWRIIEPLNALAEGFQVRGLVSALANLQSRARLEPGGARALSAADAGLEPPVATVMMTDQEGTEYAIEIGQKAVMSSDTYVRLSGKKTIHLAQRDLLPQVNKDLNEYRSKQLVQIKTGDATRLQVVHGDRTVDFTRGDDQNWVINDPVRAYADSKKVTGLLTKISGLRLDEIVEDAPESLAPYGLEKPYLTCIVTTETEIRKAEDDPEIESITETHEILIGGFADLKSEKRFVKTGSNNSVATIPDSRVQELIPDLKDLRDPKVTRLTPSDVTQFELSAGDASATVKRDGKTWKAGGDLAELDIPAVIDLLDAIANLSAINYIDEPEAPATYGLDKPRAVLSVTTTGSLEPITLRVGSKTASGLNAYIQLEGDPTVIVTRAAQADRLAISPFGLRSREIFHLPVDEIQRVELERGAARHTLVRAGKQWKLDQPANAPINIATARTLTTDLARLRAKRVVAKGNAATYGLDKPLITIRFTTGKLAPPSTQSSQPTTAEAPKLTEHSLRIALMDAVTYAFKDDDPFVFELDQTVYETLTAELIDPRVFKFTQNDVTHIKIVSTGGTLEFERRGETWTYTPDPFVELDQDKVNGLAGDLAQLKVQAYVAYREGDLAGEGLAQPPASMTIGLADGREQVLALTQDKPGELPRKAALVAERRIFHLRVEDVEKLLRGLDDYLKAD